MVTTFSQPSSSTRGGNAVPFPQQLARLDLSRFKAYRDNLNFYQGLQWLEPQRRRERRLTFNYAKAIIEKSASYVISGTSSLVDPTDGSPLRPGSMAGQAGQASAEERARRAEQALREVHEANGLDQLDLDNEIDCSVLGDAAFKVTWDPGEERVRVSAPDVQGLYAWWLGDDPSRVWRVASRYVLSHEEAQMLLEDVPPAGRSAGLRAGKSEHTIVEVWTEADFQLWLDDQLFEERENPYGFIPFVIYPNLREPKQFWGVSDLVSLKEPLRELNRALSQLSMILELSGNPIAVLENVTEAQDIAVQPGAVWEIPEKAKAYLLDLLQGGGIGLHVEYVNLILRTLHDLSEVPRSAFGENRQALSGVALQMELDPLLKKVQRKRLIRAAAFRRRNEMVLRILDRFAPKGDGLAEGETTPDGGQAFAPYRSRVVWGPVLPQDRSRLVEDEARLVAAGIHSRRTAAAALDVEDPEREWQRWREEDESALSPGPSPANGRGVAEGRDEGQGGGP